MEYDDIIVGAGSSGAVLAARLSEDPNRSVLLLEAGPDYPAVEQTPPICCTPGFPSGPHDWGLVAKATTGSRDRLPSRQGHRRLLGRQRPYRVARHARGFRRVGRVGQLRMELREGPAVLSQARKRSRRAGRFSRHQRSHLDRAARGRRPGSRSIAPFTTPAANTAMRRSADHNDPRSTGIGPWPRNRRDGIRISTAIGYLNPARHRVNLTIRPFCNTHRVIVEGGRATGVEVECGGVVQTIRARRVTLSAGAINSPAILMRSGIGPRAELEALGIKSIIDLPGVGRNLIDHLLVPVVAHPDPRRTA